MIDIITLQKIAWGITYISSFLALVIWLMPDIKEMTKRNEEDYKIREAQREDLKKKYNI